MAIRASLTTLSDSIGCSVELSVFEDNLAMVRFRVWFILSTIPLVCGRANLLCFQQVFKFSKKWLVYRAVKLLPRPLTILWSTPWWQTEWFVKKSTVDSAVISGTSAAMGHLLRKSIKTNRYRLPALVSGNGPTASTRLSRMAGTVVLSTGQALFVCMRVLPVSDTIARVDSVSASSI